MKLICNGNDLSDAVGKVFKAVGSKTTNPILESIKLKAESGALTLSATDQELFIEKSKAKRLFPADFSASSSKSSIANRSSCVLTKTAVCL